MNFYKLSDYQSQLPPLPASLVYIKEEQGTESPGRAKKVYILVKKNEILLKSGLGIVIFKLNFVIFRFFSVLSRSFSPFHRFWRFCTFLTIFHQNSHCKICQVTLKVHSSTHIKRHQSLHKHIHLNCIDSGKECSVCGGTDFDLSLCRYPNCECRICQTRKSGKNVDNKTAITNFSQSDHKSDRSENSSPVSIKRGNGSHKGTNWFEFCVF